MCEHPAPSLQSLTMQHQPPQQQKHHEGLPQSQQQNQQQDFRQNQPQNQQRNQNQQQQRQFSCLFTKQLTQKRKKWHDGRLVVRCGRAALFDADPAVGAGDPILGECEITSAQNQAILQSMETRIQTEKHIIEIQGPWISNNSAATRPVVGSKPLVSNGMKKVLSKKFRKSGKYVPPNQQQQQNQPSWLKRSRPLQPGELQRRYYGNQQPLQHQAQVGWDQQQNQSQHVNQQQSQNQQPQLPRWKQLQQQQVQQQQSSARWNQPSNRQPSQATPHNPYGQQQHQQQPPQHGFNNGNDRQQQAIAPSPQQQQEASDMHQHEPPSHEPPRQQHGEPPQQQVRPSSSWHTPPPPRQSNNTSSTLLNDNAGQPVSSRRNDEEKENTVPPASDPFVDNQFNPNSFYGEEGEEEDSPTQFNWDDPIPKHSEAPSVVGVPFADILPAGPPEGKRQRVVEEEQVMPPASVSAGSPFEPSVDSASATTSNAADESAGGNGGGAAALSTLELLQLFGASSNTPTGANEPSESIAKPPVPVVVDECKGQQQYQQQVEEQHDDKVVDDELPTQISAFQFVLPPASDSSSEDED